MHCGKRTSSCNSETNQQSEWRNVQMISPVVSEQRFKQFLFDKIFDKSCSPELMGDIEEECDSIQLLSHSRTESHRDRSQSQTSMTGITSTVRYFPPTEILTPGQRCYWMIPTVFSCWRVLPPILPVPLPPSHHRHPLQPVMILQTWSPRLNHRSLSVMMSKAFLIHWRL